MTDDIVPILRSEFNNCRSNAYYSGECCCDAKWAEDYVTLAADEIERLRMLVDRLVNAVHFLLDGTEPTGDLAGVLAVWARANHD
jgi:hypothetical protein